MSVKRQLPNTDAGRALAMDRAALKVSITPPADVVLSAQTQTRLAALRSQFNTNMALRGAAQAGQITATPGKDNDRQAAGFWLSHFIEAHDKAAKRGEIGFMQGNRSFFHLDGTNEAGHPLRTDDDVFSAGEQIINGNVNYLAAGHPAIIFPTIDNVTDRYNTFVASFGAYNNLKQAYDDAQEAISNMREDIDSLIVRIWNEVEAAYSEEEAPSMRRNARSWGVAYALVAGTAPSSDDFSIIGTVTDSTTGAPINGAAVLVHNPEVIVLTDAQGKYFVPTLAPNTYSMLVHKDGYAEKSLPSVEVTEGEILTVNFLLVAAPASSNTGTITGIVTQGGIGVSAKITIDSVAGPVTTTNATGNFVLNNVPEGAQNLRASLVADPAVTQVVAINVIAGGSIDVSINLP